MKNGNMSNIQGVPTIKKIRVKLLFEDVMQLNLQYLNLKIKH